LQWWIESTLPRQGKNLAAPDLPPPSQQYFLQWNKKIPKNLRALRKLIGKTLRYYGIPYIVVEILEEGPALVLEPQQGGESIQPDSYGRPRRTAPEPVVVKLPAGFWAKGRLPEGLELP
jgi:hypothetical protein